MLTVLLAVRLLIRDATGVVVHENVQYLSKLTIKRRREVNVTLNRLFKQ